MSASSIRNFTLWILDETNIIVTSTTAAYVIRSILGPSNSQWVTHPAGALWFIVGAVGASTIAKLLKNFLAQPRPLSHIPNASSAALRRTLARTPVKLSSTPTYGMPSTHSTTITFFSTYIFLSLLPTSPLVGLLAVVAGGTIAWSRIALGHHTRAQVLAGVGLGVALGTGHFVAWNGSRTLGTVGLRGVGEGYVDLAEVVAKRVWGQM